MSFDGPTLDWYQSNDKLERFKNWEDLKQRLLIRFRSIRDGTLVGRFLTIKQETTMEEYRNQFDKMAPVAFLQTVVLEETFMNGLSPWLKSEVETLESVGLAQMMKLALKIENRELVRRECGLSSAYGGKSNFNSNIEAIFNSDDQQSANRGKLADENDYLEESNCGGYLKGRSY